MMAVGLLPLFPAAMTTMCPGPTSVSIACSSNSVPSCAPKSEPRLRFTTAGRPRMSARLKMYSIPARTSANEKLTSPPLTAMMSALGATPAYW